MTATNIHLIDYICDICERTVEFRSYIYHDDLPDGWIRYFEYSNREYHACTKCKAQIKDGHRIS